MLSVAKPIIEALYWRRNCGSWTSQMVTSAWTMTSPSKIAQYRWWRIVPSYSNWRTINNRYSDSVLGSPMLQSWNIWMISGSAGNIASGFPTTSTQDSRNFELIRGGSLPISSGRSNDYRVSLPATRSGQPTLNGWTVLPHQLYAADVVLFDYHLFRSLQDRLEEKVSVTEIRSDGTRKTSSNWSRRFYSDGF